MASQIVKSTYFIKTFKRLKLEKPKNAFARILQELPLNEVSWR